MKASFKISTTQILFLLGAGIGLLAFFATQAEPVAAAVTNTPEPPTDTPVPPTATNTPASYPIPTVTDTPTPILPTDTPEPTEPPSTSSNPSTDNPDPTNTIIPDDIPDLGNGPNLNFLVISAVFLLIFAVLVIGLLKALLRSSDPED